MPRVTRFDAGELKLKKDAWETPEGFLDGFALGTKVGVFPYADEKGEVHYEYRPAEELFKADTLYSMRNIPVTLDHPAEGIVNVSNSSRLMKGFTGVEVKPDGDRIYTDLRITHQDAVQAVKDGKDQVSYGYQVELVQQKGEYKGLAYDFVQTNIHYNHLALVDKARMGPDAKVLTDTVDSRTGRPVIRLDGSGNQVFNEATEISHKQDEVTTMPKFKIDKLEYEAAPEVINFIDKLQAAHDDLRVKADSVPALSTQISTLTGERDQLKVQLDAELKKDHSADIHTAAARLTRIQDAARKVLPADQVAKLDSMVEPDMQRAVLLELTPEAARADRKAVLDRANADYLNAAFDQALVSLPTGPAGMKEVVIADAVTQESDDPDKVREDSTKKKGEAHKKPAK